jgi:hypothetical protein
MPYRSPHPSGISKVLNGGVSEAKGKGGKANTKEKGNGVCSGAKGAVSKGNRKGSSGGNSGGMGGSGVDA